MKLFCFKWKILIVLHTVWVTYSAMTGDKIVLNGFHDPVQIEFGNNVKSRTGEILSVASSQTGWARLARTRPGVLKPNTDYLATFRYRRNNEFNFSGFLYILVRPYSEENADSDLLYSGFLPQDEYRAAEIRFRTDNRRDWAFQIHSWGNLDAEIADFKLVECTDKLIDVIPGGSTPFVGDPGNLPSGAKEFEIERPRTGRTLIVNASEFGLNETNADNIEALNRAVEHCRKIGATKLIVPPGTYRMTAQTPVLFRNLTDFEFDGGGATFLFYRHDDNVVNWKVKDCERIFLHNFNMDWDWEREPLASLVEAVEVGTGYVDFKFFEYERFPKRDVKVRLLSSYDPVAAAVGTEGGITTGFSKPKTKWLSANVLRVNFQPKGIKPGDLFRMQHRYYGNDGFLLDNNRHLTMADINLYACAGMGIRAIGHQKYWHLLRVKIAPPAGVPRRPISVTADHCHVNRSNGFIKIEECEFGFGADDCLNIHDLSLVAVKNGTHSVKVYSNWADRIPESGAEIEFRHTDYSPTGITAPVKTVKVLDKVRQTYELVFDRELPEPLAEEVGFILFDRSYDSRNIIIRNNRFHRNRARGLLLLARDITIENNSFYHNEMGALKFETGYTLNQWSEGYGASNIVVRNNLFEAVNSGEIKNDGWVRDVFLGSYVVTDPSTRHTDYPVIRDILFEGNTFRESFGLVAFISSAENVIFRNNKFSNATRRRNPLPYRSNFFVTASRNIWIINNQYMASPYTRNPNVLVTPTSVKNVIVQGNHVVQPKSVNRGIQ